MPWGPTTIEELTVWLKSPSKEKTQISVRVRRGYDEAPKKPGEWQAELIFDQNKTDEVCKKIEAKVKMIVQQ